MQSALPASAPGVFVDVRGSLCVCKLFCLALLELNPFMIIILRINLMERCESWKHSKGPRPGQHPACSAGRFAMPKRLPLPLYSLHVCIPKPTMPTVRDNSPGHLHRSRPARSHHPTRTAASLALLLALLLRSGVRLRAIRALVAQGPPGQGGCGPHRAGCGGLGQWCCCQATQGAGALASAAAGSTREQQLCSRNVGGGGDKGGQARSTLSGA